MGKIVDLLPGKEIIQLENIEVRPAIFWWAKKMEEELRKNESKGGWEDEDYDFLLERAKANLKEIETGKLYGMNPKPIYKNYVTKCCVDCANFCMMLADTLREGGE